MRLTDEVRDNARRIAATAGAVRVHLDHAGDIAPSAPPALDPDRHYLEGSEADVATYLLTLDAINFGSGWFPTLRKRTDPATGRPVSGSFTVAWALADRFRAHGPWTNAHLRAMRADELADVLGQRRDHELMSLYAQALRQLGAFLGERGALDLARAGRSAEGFAETLAGGMSMFRDRGFYKRAQIAANDFALAGLVEFDDLHRLTIFADNLVPHVLRCDGVLDYAPELAGHVDGEHLLPMGAWEREIRGCAVEACEQIARRIGVEPRTLDVWLWNRGQAPAYKARPRHRCRCIFY